MKKVAIALTLLASLVGTANAAGNAEAGKQKAGACVACHGADGNAPVAMYPKLAGQHADYIVKQLADFKSGARKDPIMMGMAMALSEQDMADIAAFYQSQQVTEGTTPENVVQVAKNLFLGGDMERNIAACIACHGPRGNGSGLAKFPKISSQNEAYTIAQLKKFRSGERANDPQGMMGDTTKHLTDSEIEALAKYLVGLH
ncbi:cytochrome c [Psychrobium sp. 1_MG-2023]|uniref:c-type cytochrome n=1 Tax=Psychrobium sp. 1_MG-2023 TaxID=3062624 RepID=UPI000C32B4EA|nr:c-type cytochrome [Psychrobium sp. 1_MG-2023]MDP2561030.1 c-type cytochrome [Psychrobium sp. 1_MG-2023]PKF58323.1 cytochrome c4 [Alteromonadales bacterium alter-6D02]